MRRARWLTPWKESSEKPAIYHCISSVVDRRFVFGDVERQKFRVFLRMQENFSGYRVLASMLRHRVRHLTDGAVIGGKEFVNNTFTAARERFTAKRKDGAWRLRRCGSTCGGSAVERV